MSMKLLAFDTSTEVMSIAVQNGSSVLAYNGAGAAQASARLIPEIQILMRQADLSFKELDAIAFGAGPGAFTGLRAACAVAQGLGFAADVRLAPINTLHAIALQMHQSTGQSQVMAALDARMGEVYWQSFDFSQAPLGVPLQGMEPRLSRADTRVDGAPFSLGTLPQAQSLLALAVDMVCKRQLVRPSEALPIYVRNKVAQTTVEREAAKQADSSTSAKAQSL